MKRTLRLNTILLPALGRVLGKTHVELMEAAGINNTTWYHLMGHPDEITVQQLISIANGLHIPVRRFFSIDDTDVIGSQDEYIEKPYQPCHYDGKALQYIFNLHNITWQGVANVIGISRIHLRKSLLAITRLPVARFLSVCEAFGIDPFSILLDPNPTKKRDAQSRQNDETILKYLAELKAGIDKVMNEIAELGNKLDALFGTFEELSSPKVAKRAANLARNNSEG